MISKVTSGASPSHGHLILVTPLYARSQMLPHRLMQFSMFLAENIQSSTLESVLRSVKFIMSYCPSSASPALFHSYKSQAFGSLLSSQYYRSYMYGIEALGSFLSHIPLKLHSIPEITHISTFFLDCICTVHNWMYESVEAFSCTACLTYQDQLEALLSSSLPFFVLHEPFMKQICDVILSPINIDSHNSLVEHFITSAFGFSSVTLIDFCVNTVVSIYNTRSQYQYPLPLNSCISYLSKRENVHFTSSIITCLLNLALDCALDICNHFNEPEKEDSSFSLGSLYVSTISCILSNNNEFIAQISRSSSEIISCIFNTTHVISEVILEFLQSLLQVFSVYSIPISMEDNFPSILLSFYDDEIQKRFYRIISDYLSPDFSSLPSEEHWSDIQQYAYFMMFKEKDDSLWMAFIQHQCGLLIQRDDPDKLALMLELINNRLEVCIDDMKEICLQDSMSLYMASVKTICSSIYQQLFIHSPLNMTFVRRQIITCFYKFIKFNMDAFPEYSVFHEQLLSFYVSFIIQFILPSVNNIQDVSSIQFVVFNLSIGYFLSLAKHIELNVSSAQHSLFNANSAYASLLHILWSRVFSITSDFNVILQKSEWILFLEPLARFTPPLLYQKDYSTCGIVQYILIRQWRMNVHPSHLAIYLSYWKDMNYPQWIGSSMIMELIQCSGSYLQQVFISLLSLLPFIITKELSDWIYQVTKKSKTWWIDRKVLISWIDCIKTSRKLANLPACFSNSISAFKIFKICSSDDQEERQKKHMILISSFKEILGIVWNKLPTFCVHWLFVEADWNGHDEQDIKFLTSSIISKVPVPLILKSLDKPEWNPGSLDKTYQINTTLIKYWIESLYLQLESLSENEILHNYIRLCTQGSLNTKIDASLLTTLGNLIMYCAKRFSRTDMLVYRTWMFVMRHCYLCKASPDKLSLPYTDTESTHNQLYLWEHDVEYEADANSQVRSFPTFSHMSFLPLLNKYDSISTQILNKIADLCSSSDIMESMIIPDPYRRDVTTCIIHGSLESSLHMILREKPFSMMYCKPNWIIQVANIMMAQDDNQVIRFRSNIFWRVCQFQPSSIISMRLLRYSSNAICKYGIHSLLTSCSTDHALYYVPQLVQLILRNDKVLIPLLILELVKKDRRFAHLVIWNMKANMIVEKNAPMLSSFIQRIMDSMHGQEKEFCDREFKFFSSVTGISGLLKPYLKHSKAEKKAFLDEELRKVVVDPGVYLPSSPEYTVTGIDYQSGGRPLQSHAKTPFMATFFVQDEHGQQLPKSVIFKVGDDCRQDMLALQVIGRFQKVFQAKGLELFLYPYRVVATAPGCGVIEVIPNAISRDQLGREKINRLNDYFVYKYGSEHSEKFHMARRCFIQSLAAYSVVSYLLAIRDRHNGNIMLDDEGHIIHIDFGFILDIAPGGIKFERAPFKLTAEMIQLIGGYPDSSYFKYFRKLCVDAFLASRSFIESLVGLVELMMEDSGLPCLKSPRSAVTNFRNRFRMDLSDDQAHIYMEDLIKKSYNNITTRLYDSFQYRTNEIPY